MELPTKHLLIFDFDGVIGKLEPEKPRQHYDDIPKNIKSIHDSRDYILAVASFNASAAKYLKKWGILHYFTAIRGGSNRFVKPRKSCYNTYGIFIPLSKPLQIESMLENELAPFILNIKLITFFDDDPDNIKEVNHHHSTIDTILIDPEEGFDLHLLPI